jgi:ribosomal-protein-alanine N-acetyltransferase
MTRHTPRAPSGCPPAMPLTLGEPIESARLRVRGLRDDDLPALLEVNGDPTVTRMLPYPAWTTLADAQAWQRRMESLQADGSTLQLVVADRATDTAIGTCLLFRYDAGSARAELGYVLGRAHWGSGRMREALAALIDRAFGAMGLRRIEAEVDPRNEASTRLLLALGFTREGLLRQRWVTRGEAKDVAVFGLLSHEWPRARAS